MVYTKGTWKFEVRNNQAMVTVDRNGVDMVVAANLFDEELDLEIEELDSNARLMAAAPDLLEALDELCNWFGEDRSDWDDWEGVDEVLDNAQNAIAKATGGE